MGVKLTLATTTAVGLLMGAAFAGSNNEVYIDQFGSGNSASIVQGQTNGSTVGNRAGYETTRIRQDGADNQLIINQTHNSSVNSPPRNQSNRVGAPGDQAGLGIDQTGNANYLRIDQTGSNQAVFEVQQYGGTSATSSSNNATIVQDGGWSARVSNLRQTFTGGAADASNDVTITQTGQSSRVGNTSSGPRSDGSGAHQTGFGNQLNISQTGNSQLVYTATQTNDQSAGGANIAEISQGGGNSNQLRELRQVNTGGADNTATLTFTGMGNGSTNAAFTGPASDVSVAQSRVRQTGEGNDISFDVTGNSNLFGFVQDGAGNWMAGIVEGSANQVATSQIGDGHFATLDILGDSNRFGIEQTGDFNEAYARANGNANDLALSQSGVGNFGEVAIGDWTASNSNSVVLNQEASSTAANDGQIFVDGNTNAVSLNQVAGWDSNLGEVVIEGSQNQVAVDQNGSNEGFVNVYGNGNGVTLGQDGDVNYAVVDVGGNNNGLDIDQSGDWNYAWVQAYGNANNLTLGQTGDLNTGEVYLVGDSNTVSADQNSSGGENSLIAAVTGDSNVLNVSQTNSSLYGDMNSIEVDIYGNSNNTGGAFALAASSAVAGGLAPGDLVQSGSGNSISLQVGSSLAPASDLNQFAFAQQGNGNTIDGSIMGSGNEVAIVQAGNGNYATFSQVGSGNSIGISQ
ncbi:curlin [Nitratireductor aestuarii]|uniref:Curlin n=1 Tax=Nitratireductor aestuarii TaxID=1735103 RepID=A0A916RST9_9HYPH|nr:hypothetical protein [Nitratireductor aestuarii]GGA68540.1 curlin [Nitratireductor aestuarii]